MNKVKLTIGDWSKDGHSKSEVFVYDVNKNVKEIRQAYKDSCVKTGLQFNHNYNYSGLPIHSKYGTAFHICTEYESGSISDEALKILGEHGIHLSNYYDDVDSDDYIEWVEIEVFAEIILEFIKLSLPDLEWKEGRFKKSELSQIDPINGWWNEDLNVQFGYGLFE